MRPYMSGITEEKLQRHPLGSAGQVAHACSLGTTSMCRDLVAFALQCGAFPETPCTR